MRVCVCIYIYRCVYFCVCACVWCVYIHRDAGNTLILNAFYTSHFAKRFIINKCTPRHIPLLARVRIECFVVEDFQLFTHFVRPIAWLRRPYLTVNTYRVNTIDRNCLQFTSLIVTLNTN